MPLPSSAQMRWGPRRWGSVRGGGPGHSLICIWRWASIRKKNVLKDTYGWSSEGGGITTRSFIGDGPGHPLVLYRKTVVCVLFYKCPCAAGPLLHLGLYFRANERLFRKRSYFYISGSPRLFNLPGGLLDDEADSENGRHDVFNHHFKPKPAIRR